MNISFNHISSSDAHPNGSTEGVLLLALHFGPDAAADDSAADGLRLWSDHTCGHSGDQRQPHSRGGIAGKPCYDGHLPRDAHVPDALPQRAPTRDPADGRSRAASLQEAVHLLPACTRHGAHVLQSVQDHPDRLPGGGGGARQGLPS